MLRSSLILIALLAAVPAHAGNGEQETEPTSRNTSAIGWLSYADGLAAARGLGMPILLWIAPASCPDCGANTFDDPEVIGLLSDFVPVRVTDEVAPRLLASKGELHVMLLDQSGAPLPDLTVEADDPRTLPTDALIDLMSSGLDVLR